jgi:hypothetical protein
MEKLLWLLTIIAMPAFSHGGESMVKTNFTDVYADSRVDSECPFGKDLINEIWYDHFQSAGLQLAVVEPEAGFLFAEIQCFAVDGSDGEYNYSFFSQWTWLQGEVFPLILLRLDYGRGDYNFLVSSVEELVEASVDKYLEANQGQIVDTAGH